jgi:lipopolysaccharide transport system ATP-binding protein
VSSPAIKADNLTKIFRLYDKPVDRLKEALSPVRRKYHHDFRALSDVSLEVRRGECVGIIGLNGSGKSTLLQLIAGVLTPTSGTVQVDGKIAALLELGAGFNQEFTGLENVFFQCSIMGYSRPEIERLIPKIVEFADIGDFVNHQVKTYSSGMYVRLAFAVAISVDPDILIVDEALAVGDVRFQAKCMAKIRDFRQSGKSLLFVSHDPGAVKSLCNRAYLLDRGKVVDAGDPDKVFDFYNGLIAEHHASAGSGGDEQFKQALRRRSGSGRLRFDDVRVCDASGRRVETFVSGARMFVELDVTAHEETLSPSFGILLRDRLGNDIFGTNSHQLGQDTGLWKAGAKRRVLYELPLNLGAGLYNVTVAAHAGDAHVEDNYDWLNEAAVFRVIHAAGQKFSGVCRLDASFSVESEGGPSGRA